jgi:polysaccharide deacetylase 2 family uncharacterized protein YibQ
VNQNGTGHLPYKKEPKYEDPFVAAIKKNPRPLSMVVIGMIGMPLILWLAAPDRTETPGQPPAFENSAQPIERVTPAPLETTLDTPTESLATPEPDLSTAVSSTPDALPFFEDSVSLLPNPVIETPMLVPERPSIALIIDDIGYNGPLGEQAIALPGAVTFAVLPHTPHGKELAELAHQQGKEIMLHAPMSNLANMPLGPGALTAELSKEVFVATLNDDIDAIPYLQGVNNHMGSALTEMAVPMQWVMEVLKTRNLYFVDSYTTAKSVAGKTAKEQLIPTLTRNVFLDNVQSHEDIDREFKKLLKLAREKGVAVGIGHPYKETLAYLEQALPLLEEQGIELITASQMIQLQRNATAAW